MIPSLRHTRISKHAAEFAGQTAKSVAKHATRQADNVSNAARKVSDMATGVAQKTSGAAQKTTNHAAGVGMKAAKTVGQSATHTAKVLNEGVGNAAGNLAKIGNAGASTAQAQATMMVEQMYSIASGSSGGGGAAPTASFTSADQAAVIDAIKPAVKQAVDMWKLSAHFSGLNIMAVSAIGAPGCLDGPELESHIRIHPKVQSLSGLARDMANGIAEGFSDNFFLWQDRVTVPGLPWYPAFAAWPGPNAPPTPNVPMPLISCVSARASKIIVHSEIADAITQALPAPLSGETAFINRVATGLALGASTWLGAAQVMNVLGYGPVPTFAPPYVPVGPVVGGTNVPAPGHLMAAPSLNPIIV